MSGHGSASVAQQSSKDRRELLESSEWLSSNVISSTDIYFPQDEHFNASIPQPVSELPASASPTKAPSRTRKSKVQAMHKLQHQSAQEAPPPVKPEPKDIPPPFMPGPSENPARKAWKTPLAPPLDFASVALQSPSDFPTRSHDTRPFNLAHCPVFRPTPDEFARPMEYLEKVARQATDEYGIAKVIPPDGWKPPFSLDTETFHFNTRLQRLNSMEATARANINFMEQLFVFHRQQPGHKVSIPILDDRPVDLWRMRKAVRELGGHAEVSKERKWAWIAKMLGYNPKVDPGVVSELKTAYLKIILPFELHMEHIRINAVVPPTAPREKEEGDPALSMLSRMGPAGSNNHAPVTATDIKQASEKLNQALAADAEGMDAAKPANTRRLLRTGDACEVCHYEHEPHRMVLCDDCDRAFHLACLTPPLTNVPRSDWVCNACITSTGADYGFEVGPDHSLYTYRLRADEFKRRWLEQHPPPAHAPSRYAKRLPPKVDSSSTNGWQEHLEIEDHIEREFWRLVQSQTEVVEVEYGADLHSSKYGSGFPQLERDPLDPYARDGWNLNNLPILAGSLLRYIRSDIAGMTNPWLYAGMAFSTFAWHKEDHYTYSVNYHHFGDTKTWYAVPGDDDFKLEAAMKRAAPELFEQQPDLMFQLVTMLSPPRLQEEGVRVCACDQRAGEFVITMPRSYHAGFNHGFNVCEAVNFCLPDWLPHGLACVQHYRELHKLPVFSHDQLVCTIFMHEKNPKAARWLYPFFKEMVERELERRDQARSDIKGLEEVVLDVELPEAEGQCVHCKCYCFLSQIVATTAPYRATCVEHAHKVLGDMAKTMRIRYTDDDLRMFLKRVKNRADKAVVVSTSLVDDGEARKSGRKRVPTAAALEAMGQQVLPLAQRRKLAHDAGDASTNGH